MTEQYPNNTEIRAWAMSVNPRAVSRRGQLSRAVIAGWNKTHPDRPYVASEAYHGTTCGYVDYDCRCDRCSAVATAAASGHRRAREDERRTFSD